MMIFRYGIKPTYSINMDKNGFLIGTSLKATVLNRRDRAYRRMLQDGSWEFIVTAGEQARARLKGCSMEQAGEQTDR